MTHGKPQLTTGTERRRHTYLVQILTAGKAETDPQEPGRQSETREINKMRSLSSLEPRAPAIQDLSFLPGLLYASGSRTSFSLHGSRGKTSSNSYGSPSPLPQLGVAAQSTPDRTPWSNSLLTLSSYEDQTTKLLDFPNYSHIYTTNAPYHSTFI